MIIRALIMYVSMTAGMVSISTADASEISRVLTFTEFPSAEVCRTCHASIYDQWSRSQHRMAWKSPLFRRSTNDYAITGCLGCHIPSERVVADMPDRRSAFEHEGVTCASCHWDPSGTIYGPRGAPAPHRTTKDERLTTAESCQFCHMFGNTYTQWETGPLASQGVSCRQCHQSAVESNVADGAAAQVYDLAKRPVAGHMWPGASDSLYRASALIIDVQPVAELGDDGFVDITLHNVGAGHTVPSGWHARTIELGIVLHNEDGDSLSTINYVVSTHDSSGLAPLTPRTVRRTFGIPIPQRGEISGTLWQRTDPSEPRVFTGRYSWPIAPQATFDIDGWPE
jgi:hypothetical protein